METHIEISKLTSKFQATIPAYVRNKIGLNQGDRLGFVEEGGKFYLQKLDLSDIEYYKMIDGMLAPEWGGREDEATFKDW